MKGERKRSRIKRFKVKGIRREYKQKLTETLNTEWKNVTTNAHAQMILKLSKMYCNM